MATTPTTLDGALDALSQAQARIAELEDGQLFTSSLRLLERGVLDRQIGEAMQELTERCVTLQKSGTLALKLTVKPDDADDARLKVLADFTAKPPKLPRNDSVLFLEHDGSLTRNYPQQMTSPALGGEDD